MNTAASDRNTMSHGPQGGYLSGPRPTTGTPPKPRLFTQPQPPPLHSEATMSEHANGAKSVIAKTISGSQTPDDHWYEIANHVLDELRAEGYTITAASGTQ